MFKYAMSLLIVISHSDSPDKIIMAHHGVGFNILGDYNDATDVIVNRYRSSGYIIHSYSRNVVDSNNHVIEDLIELDKDAGLLYT